MYKDEETQYTRNEPQHAQVVPGQAETGAGGLWKFAVIVLLAAIVMRLDFASSFRAFSPLSIFATPDNDAQNQQIEANIGTQNAFKETSSEPTSSESGQAQVVVLASEYGYRELPNTACGTTNYVPQSSCR